MNRKLYKGTGSTRSEIDLRKEFDELIYGSPGKIPHGRKIFLRKLRRLSNGQGQPCACKGNGSREPSPSCQYCFGEGYLWDEEWADTYSTYAGEGSLTSRITYGFPGSIRSDGKIFYLRYDTKILYGDKVVEIKLDSEGLVVVPYKRTNIYKIHTIQEMRSDYGRVEFLVIHTREEDSIRLENY